MKQKIKQLFLLVALFALIPQGMTGGIKADESICVHDSGSSYDRIVKAHPAQNTIRFTENKNQWDKNVLYRAQLDGGVLFLERNCFTYNFYDKETLRKNHIGKQKTENGERRGERSSALLTSNSQLLTPNSQHPAIRSHAFRMTLLGADETVEVTEKQITPDYCNFYIGQDQSKWASKVKNFKEIIYQNIYDGIDLQILGLQNSLKYNFIVSPQAHTEDLQLYYEGLESITLQKSALLLKTSINEISEQKPYAYQLIKGKQVEVPCEFILTGTTVSFHFPKGYEKNSELIIDPILVFAASTGSTADNFGMTATYDSQGCLYAGGTVYGAGYPFTLGAYDTSWNGGPLYLDGRTDVVISKYDASGTFMLYSTYLGGTTSTEIVSSLVVNAQNELMLFGATGSSDFPVTTGAFETTFKGGAFLYFQANGTKYINGTDLYVAKFNSTGTSLLASTFLGGTQNDGVNDSPTLAYNYGDYYRGEIQVDNAGNCYIASCTYSSNFPTTLGCPQPIAGGGLDGVVFKMNPSLTALTWSTYVGGMADDGCYALTLDNLLNVYTTGGTSSTNFPITSGTLDTTYNGGITDGFITKIKSDGSEIMNSMFVGTSAYDQSFLIQFDKNFNLYIIGQSEGVMPVSAGVYSNPNSKQFIWKIDSTLSTKLFTTIFGNGNGQVNISPSAFLVDGCDNIYVCGWGGNILTVTPTTNMPLTPNALQPATDGFNFYLFVLAPDATSLLYATYFGGGQSQEHVDGGTSRFDKKGIVYQAVCSGCGGNDDFPVTPGSWPYTASNYTPHTNGVPASGINMSSNCNEGVFKFDFQAAGVSAELLTVPNDTVCVGTPVVFNNTSTNAFNYVWNFGDNSPLNTTVSPSHIFTAPGNYDVMLIAVDSSGCILSDTANLVVVVLPPPVVNLGNDIILCQTPSVLLDAGTSGTIYTWSTGATSQTIVATTVGTYWVTVGNVACSDSDSINIQQVVEPELGADTILCVGQGLALNAPPSALAYQWSTGATTQTIVAGSAGQYWVSVNWGTCQTKDTINIATIPYPVVNLPATAQICPGDSVLLNPGNNTDATYLWSTGEVTQSAAFFAGGTYSVKVSNQQCSIWDSTVVVGVAPIPLDDYVTLCNVEKYTLDAGSAGVSYLWSTGETSQKIDIKVAGKYWVVMNTSLCTLSDTIIVDGSLGSGVLWFPNSFTPNGDQLNDFFMVKGLDITYFQMMIFNRWGDLIFETEKLDSGWNGMRNGKLVELDVYVWKVKYKTLCDKNLVKTKIGHVSVIR